MKPYNARKKFDYLSPNTLYKIASSSPQTDAKIEIIPADWIAKDSIPLLQYISGYYSGSDTNWETINWKKEAVQLAFSLRSEKDQSISTWEQLLNDLFEAAEIHLLKDPAVSPATIKLIIHDLKFRIRLINHELSHICVNLSTFAERELFWYVFSKVYATYSNFRMSKRIEDLDKKKNHKFLLEKYFLQKIQARQMTRGTLNRATMDKSDENFSNTFSIKFIDSVKRESEAYAIELIKVEVFKIKGLFSHETLFLEAHEIIKTEVLKEPDREILEDNLVINFICQRNEALKRLFTDKWNDCLNKAYKQVFHKVLTKFSQSIHILQLHFEIMLSKLLEISAAKNNSDGDVRCFDSDCNFELIQYFLRKNHASDNESPFKAMSLFLKKHLDPNITRLEMEKYFLKFKINGVEMKLSDTYSLVSKDDDNQLEHELFKKLVNTTMFDENIFNLYVYLQHFIEKLKSYKFDINEKELQEFIIQIRDELFSDSIGCVQQCPSCGKFCEREVHTDGSKCQIKTGHQFSSMGGKVWQADEQHTAILYRCDVYNDDMQVHIPGNMIKWSEFKKNTSREWNWEPCLEEAFEVVKSTNLKLMISIWNKFGRGILEYYRKNTGVYITYIPYDPSRATIVWKYSVCFVVDGTSSMSTDIVKARVSIETLINTYKSSGKEIEFRVVIYRDHCDPNILEEYPNSSNKDFTKDSNSVVSFMDSVGASGGGDFPEAVVDGLGTAAKANWRIEQGRKCMIIHIFDAPPHGNFPNYRNHDSRSDSSYCCCCSVKCLFDWDRDVWEAMKKQEICYYGISTGPSYTAYENTMKAKLGALCEGFTVCGKEEVNEAVMKIFIQYENLC